MNNKRKLYKILYRDRKHGIIGGVCAGIADYFGINRLIVRLITLVSLFLFTLPTSVIYLLAMFFLKSRQENLELNDDEKKIWQSIHRSPQKTIRNIRSRFSDMEERVQGMESYLTSRKHKLDRAFKNLKD
jgi:phage shock protein C